MRTILVPVERHNKTETVLRLAAVAAIRFGSVVEGLAFRTLLPPGFEWDITAGGMIYEPDETPERIRDAAQARFAQVMREQGLRSALEGERVARVGDGRIDSWLETRPSESSGERSI